MRIGRFIKRHLEQTSLVLLVVVCIGFVVVLRLKHSKITTYKNANVCSTNNRSKLLEKSAKAIVAKDNDAQKRAIDEIKGIHGFEYDQNCLFPLVEYYISRGDADNATTYYNKLAKIYKPETIYMPYASQFGASAEKPESLRLSVEGLQKQKAELTKNSQFDVGVEK